MMPKPPEYVLECIRQAGKSFYDHLDALNWPDANRDAPAKEANVVLHIARELMQADPAFHVYLEAAVPTSGRLDLLAANHEVAIALEAKCFGNIGKQAMKLANDVDRLRHNYFPQYAELKDSVEVEDWWRKVQKRWGIAVVASFRGQEIAQAWKSTDSAYLRDYKDRAGFDELLNRIRNTYLDAFPINDGNRWKSCGEVYLLISAFEV